MSTAVSRTEAHDEAAPHARPIAWYGMVFFIASEAVFFANLIAAYLYLRVRDGASFNPVGSTHAELDTALAAVNTVILLSSSIPMHLAGRSIAKGNRRGLKMWLPATIILGAAFVSIQLYEYVNNGFGPDRGAVGSTFYVLTGFHGAHVTAGIILLLVCFFRSLRGDFTKDRHFAVTAGEMYWHFVDAVWIVLFTSLYVLQAS
ncbi:MAG TPA: cytochrome c oxidase subunit 3 [Ktedonobacterales bacterium]|nr:cytochrome c oxidase subunit 3 [Ktedonobacterales bacterium]